MTCHDCTDTLHDYMDGEVEPSVTQAMEQHLAQCPACRAQHIALQRLRQATAALPRTVGPARDLWPELAHTIASASATGSSAVRRSVEPRATISWLVPFAVAASIVLLAAFGDRRGPPSPAHGNGWSVAALAGAPRVGSRPVHTEGTLRIGQWLETDAVSRARLAVGTIGEVSLEPNSRLRLLQTAPTDHRLELARGTLHAMISAPPRLFVVDTPAATAVDLGCSYTLNVDDDGAGLLHVTTGYVALEQRGRKSIIPWGAMCRMQRGAGPGTPFAEDAPEAMRAALQRIDFAGDRTDATLAAVLGSAREQDAVTLWHLLPRTTGAQRIAVFDTLARFHRLPAGVTRAGILAGDEAMHTTWGEDLGLGGF